MRYLPFRKLRHVSGIRPLFPSPVTEPVNGQLPGDLSEEGREKSWSVGRHGIPGFEIGVIDTFLAVPDVGQNVVCDFKKIGSVFPAGYLNGRFVPQPVQFDDSAVFHIKFPLAKYPMGVYNKLKAEIPPGCIRERIKSLVQQRAVILRKRGDRYGRTERMLLLPQDEGAYREGI